MRTALSWHRLLLRHNCVRVTRSRRGQSARDRSDNNSGRLWSVLKMSFLFSVDVGIIGVALIIGLWVASYGR